MKSLTPYHKIVSSLVALQLLIAPAALGDDRKIDLEQDQAERIAALVEAEIQSLENDSNKKIIAEFESLAATIYNPANKALLEVNENTPADRKEAIAAMMIRYNAVRTVVSEIPGAKEKVYVKLFGDRENSPYYGAVSQDEFKGEGYLFGYALTGAPIFLILYALANMED